MFVPQFLQRTVFPRALPGTANTLRHVRFGHMIRTVSAAIGWLPRLVASDRPVNRSAIVMW